MKKLLRHIKIRLEMALFLLFLILMVPIWLIMVLVVSPIKLHAIMAVYDNYVKQLLEDNDKYSIN